MYVRQLKISQLLTKIGGLQPSMHKASAPPSGLAGAKHDGCGATTAAPSSCASAPATCQKKDKKKGKKRKGHCRRA